MSAARRPTAALRLLLLLAVPLAGLGFAGATGRLSQPAAARALSPACTGLAFTTSPASAQPQGTLVAITGTASGCPDPSPLYEYWVLPPNSQTYQLVQSWTTGSATWNTTGAVPGSWWITVWAKDAQSTTQSYDVDAGAGYSLTAACPSVTLSVSPASPQPDGAQVTLTGTAQNCSDPNPLYRYWVQTGPNTYVLIHDWTTGSATWNTNGLTPGSYWLIVWAKDADSVTQSYDSDAGAPYTLSTATAPGTVTLTSPSNNATNTGTTPAFSWTAPSGAVAGTTTYTVTIWNPYTSPSATKVGDFSAGTSTTYTPPSGTLASGASYLWNVSACNGQACSGYGPWWQLSTSAAPHTAQQTAPANGATGTTLTPTLSWTAPDNALPGTTTYTVSIWDAYAPPAGHLLGNLPATTSLSTTVPASESLYYSQTYYWSLTACNGSACSAYSTPWFSFSTENQPQATLSGAGQTEVTNGDFSGAAIGATSIPGWSGTATIAADPGGFTYAHGVSSLSSSSLTLDFASLDNNHNAADWFRIGYRLPASDSTLNVSYNGSTVFSAPYLASTAWTEQAFAVPYTAGASGQLTLTGGGSVAPDVAYVQRMDGPAGRGGTTPALVTGAFSTSVTDLSVNGVAGPLRFGRVYDSSSVNTGATWNASSLTTGPLGPKWWDNWQYSLIFPDQSAASQLVGVVQPGGSIASFTWENAAGGYVPPTGVHDTLTLNGTTWTLATASQVQLIFTSFTSGCAYCASYLTSVVDRAGNTTTLSYDDHKRVTAITDAGGRQLTLSYNGTSDQLASVSDGTGTVSYSYDGTTGDLTGVTDVRGGDTSYAYRGHALTSVTDPRRTVVLQPAYDTSGRLQSVQDAAGKTTSISYASPGAGATQVTDPRNHLSTLYFDAGLRATDFVDPYSNLFSTSHDSQNNPAGSVDPLGDSVAYTYDQNGNVLTAEDGAGYTTSYSYDGFNDVLTATDPLGQELVNSYTSKGLLIGRTLKNASGGMVASWSYTVNGLGQLTQTTDPNNHAWSFGYNPAGDRTSITDPYSKSWSYGVDYAGRVTAVTDPNSHTTSTTYDRAGNVLTTTDASNHTTTSTYDADGNLATVQDGNGNTTTYSYTSRNLLQSVQDPVNGASHLTSYAYDAAGNRTSVTDANGHTTNYTYDNNGRVLTVTDPNSVVQHSYAYDTAGRLLSDTDAKNQKTSYSYTSRGQVATITYADGSSVSYSYDALGNRASMTDSTGTTSYQYDPRNLLTQVTAPGGRTVGYTYDAAGNRTGVSYPFGVGSVTDGYDQDNRLTSVADWLGNTTTYAYDAAGRLATATLPAQSGGQHVVGSYAYFSNDALQSVSWALGSTTLASAAYTLDQANNRTSRQTSLAGTPNVSQIEGYCYDGLNRLTAVYPSTSPTCGSGTPSQTFTYDRAGNRTAMTTSSGTTSYSYDNADQLTSVTPPSPAAPVSYTYDKNGAVTARGSDSFTWNAARQLAALSVAGSDPENFTYNGDGLRQTRTDTTTNLTTSFVWDVSVSTPVVLDDGTQYVYGASGLAEQVVNGTPFSFLSDGSGSTMGIVDSTGTLQQTYGYDVYGKATAGTNNHPSEFQFDGQETDPSGLQYLRARYYDPSTGRFLSRDSGGGAGYMFAGDDPVTRGDPSGMCTVYLVAASVAYEGGHTGLDAVDTEDPNNPAVTTFQAGPQYSGIGVLNPFGPGFGQLTPNNSPVTNVLPGANDYIVYPEDGLPCSSNVLPALAGTQGTLQAMNQSSSTQINYGWQGAGNGACNINTCANSNNYVTSLLYALGLTPDQIEAIDAWLRDEHSQHAFAGFGTPANIPISTYLQYQGISELVPATSGVLPPLFGTLPPLPHQSPFVSALIEHLINGYWGY